MCIRDSSYTDGRYTHEWAKIDRGGNLPLYLRQSKSTANSFTNLARFGDHSNSIHEFEVFGSIKATHFYGDGSNLTNISASAPSNMVTTDTTQTISGAKTFSTQPTFNSDILVNGHVYGRYVNSQYSLLYRFGGLFFTWDSDSYGTNTHHSIRSTYGDSFTDSITLNSFNHFRVNSLSLKRLKFQNHKLRQLK